MRQEPVYQDSIFVIHDFLSPEECREAIAIAETRGFTDAPITTSWGFLIQKDVRDNTRVMVDDPALALRLFERARPFLPERIDDWRLHGLNERFRYYRYDVGQTFRPHYDGSFARSAEEESQLTFMVYLNDGYAGGTTDFYHPDRRPRASVRPVAGMALVFVHQQLHEGAPIVEGRKYVLRTDVLYRTETR
jgi:hypothetical protein